MNESAVKAMAERQGIYETLAGMGREVVIEIPLYADFTGLPIEELNLGARSFNGLKRAGINTVGRLAKAVSENELPRIRNLGKVSIREINETLLNESYSRLSESAKDSFITGTMERNGI